MSDYNSSLPVRSEADGTDERLHAKIVDGTTPSQRATVDTDGNLHIENHANNPAGTDTVLKVSEQGSPNTDGFYNVSNNSIPSSSALVAHTRAASPASTDQIQRITAITSSTVHALDISLHDELGNAYSESNPLHVTFSEDGTSVNDYNTSAALAAAGTSNHDYTVTAGKTLHLSQIYASASGKLKIEVQIESGVATNVFASKFVGFNSTAETNILIPVGENIFIAAGVRVRIIRTNKDKQAEDVYSTISGHEV